MSITCYLISYYTQSIHNSVFELTLYIEVVISVQNVLSRKYFVRTLRAIMCVLTIFVFVCCLVLESLETSKRLKGQKPTKQYNHILTSLKILIIIKCQRNRVFFFFLGARAIYSVVKLTQFDSVSV